jgi:hypothetical protein
MKPEKVNKYFNKLLSYRYIQNIKTARTLIPKLHKKLKGKFQNVQSLDFSDSMFDITFETKTHKFTGTVSCFNDEWYCPNFGWSKK